MSARPQPGSIERLLRRSLVVVLALAALGVVPGVAAASGGAPAGVDVTNADRCDFLDPAVCLFPWPNDHFTKPDRHSETGRRVNLAAASTPRNKDGLPLDVTEYNRSDGFSPGQVIITKVPGLDTPAAFEKTGAVPITDMGRAFDRRAPVVVIDAKTGRRHLIWAELDSNASTPADVALLIHPGVNFKEGHRYIVALRNLKDASGRTIPAGPAFRLYRDRRFTRIPQIERRRWHMESLFWKLGRAGIDRRDLYLAWDFTVSSERNLTERSLGIRNDAFRQLGDGNLRDVKVRGTAPKYTISTVTDFKPCGTDGCAADEDNEIARRVEGTLEVPCYLDQPGCPPGSRFHFEHPWDRVPTQIPGNTQTTAFICNIPRVAVDGVGVRPGRPSLYGHGLLGRPSEVNAGNVQSMSNEHDFVFCATRWSGMADEDIPNAVSILGNFALFPSLTDRLQQGFVAQLFLGRLLIHPNGFSANAAFRDEGRGVIDTRRLFYDGNSQGGIFGGALTALSPDFTRAVLGVPGMNYSVLLQRSVDFDGYAMILNPAYTNEIERPLLLSMVQMLWDRSDPNGYAHHITDDPLPGTPSHKVLLQVALGDHQVANITAEVEARTIGARLRVPAQDLGRSFDRVPQYGIPSIRRFPFDGSALVIFDTGPLRTDANGEPIGTPPAPITNTPPRAGEDPHSAPRSDVNGRIQKSEFLRIGGHVINVCGSRPCYADGWTGP